MFSTAIYTKGTSTNRGIVSCACADDFVVLCRSEDEAKEAPAAVERLLADRLGLNLSAEKTKVTRFHEGFSFLGFDIKSRIVIGYYELRWLVEEYHKALKTGCSVEKRQLKTAAKLEAMVGLMSVVAVRLLRLKSLARTNPDVPAKRVVPNIWLQMLKVARQGLDRVHDLTVGQFYREVAKLGGFIGRKSDGQPGWITIWRGWEKLNTYVQAASLASKLKIPI